MLVLTDAAHEPESIEKPPSTIASRLTTFQQKQTVRPQRTTPYTE